MSGYEQKLASQCGLTLITEMDPILHARSAARDAAFVAAGIDPNESYDLLSVPSFRGLLADANHIYELVENVKLALSIHRPETVAILHKHEGSSCRKCVDTGELTSILEQRRLPAKVINVFGNFTPEDDPRSRSKRERLVITCMDYRLHYPVSLPRLVARGDEEASTSWITYPGAAYIARNISGFTHFLDDMRCLSRMPDEIMVVSHTDCAKYKGFGLKHGELSWEELEPKILRRDLNFIGEVLHRFFARPKVETDIAVIARGNATRLW